MKSHGLMICRDLLDPHGKEAVSGRKQSWINTTSYCLSQPVAIVSRSQTVRGLTTSVSALKALSKDTLEVESHN
jgi:hypothetical protein